MHLLGPNHLLDLRRYLRGTHGYDHALHERGLPSGFRVAPTARVVPPVSRAGFGRQAARDHSPLGGVLKPMPSGSLAMSARTGRPKSARSGRASPVARV